MNKSFLNLISQLKLNNSSKNEFFITKKNNKKIELLQILLRHNIIDSYSYENNKIKIILNKQIKFNISTVSTVTNRKIMTLGEMKNEWKQTKSFYIMSTNTGIQVTSTAPQAGVILFEITPKK